MERIEDYGIVGDLQTAALIGRSGSVDWLCFPRFDSSSCFGALLGTPDNGRWLIAPDEGGPATSRCYRENTLVLESEWQTSTGRVRVIDFMPPREKAPDIVRIVEGLEGRVEMCTELTIRLDYGSVIPWVQRLDDETLLALGGPDGITVRTPVDLEPKGMSHVARFSVRAGERVPFVLTWFPSNEAHPTPVDPEAALRDTEAYWREWMGGCAYHGDYREAVHSSLLTLKALTYEPTGGIVAAPTTSLPEQIGGVRNWDYRYCWLRDATFTLFALMNAGFTDEARAWRNWLLRAVAGDPAKAQILYGVGGQRRIREYELDWLPGYESSEAGAHRQRGTRSVPARRLRRGDGRTAPGARARAAGRRPRLVAPAEPDGFPRGCLGSARRGNLGGARPTPPLHPLESAGVGRVRPCGRHGRTVRPAGADRQVAADPADDP